MLFSDRGCFELVREPNPYHKEPCLCSRINLVLLKSSTLYVSLFSNMKQKLWPPIPDLHHVLDGFLEDNSKQQQQVGLRFPYKY